jgi:hypothetical protein
MKLIEKKTMDYDELFKNMNAEFAKQTSNPQEERLVKAIVEKVAESVSGVIIALIEALEDNKRQIKALSDRIDEMGE